MIDPAEVTKRPLLDINAEDFEEDPNLPFSGGSSAAFVNDDLNKPAAKLVEKQKRQRSDLMPVANDIFKFLNEERDALANIHAYISTLGPTTDLDADKLLSEYRARELYITFLKRFELWMTDRLQTTSARRK